MAAEPIDFMGDPGWHPGLAVCGLFRVDAECGRGEVVKRTNKCPKCGSGDVIANARAVDRGHLDIESELTVATFRNPGALIFKGQLTTTVSAWVCVDCGYIEFYADSPRGIDVGSHAT
jgi:ribosomal protein S27AE